MKIAQNDSGVTPSHSPTTDTTGLSRQGASPLSAMLGDAGTVTGTATGMDGNRNGPPGFICVQVAISLRHPDSGVDDDQHTATAAMASEAAAVNLPRVSA